MSLRPVDTNRYLNDLRFLSDVTRETLSSLQLNKLLRRVVSLLRERFGYDYAAVAMVEDDQVVFRAGSGGDLDQVFKEPGSPPSWIVPVRKGIVGTVASSAKPKMVNNVAEEPDYIFMEFLAKTKSELAVPLIHREEVLGILDVQSNKLNAFDDTDVRLLEIVAALVAPAVELASLHEKWRRRMRYLHLSGEISRMVMSSLSQENVISVSCAAILEALEVSFVGIALLDSAREHVIHTGHATHLELVQEEKFSIPLGSGLVGRVAARGLSMIIGSVDQLPDFIPVVEGMQSAMAVPLKIRDQVIGVLDLEHSRNDHFTEEDERQMESLAAYLAQALENAQLFDNQRRRWQQLLVINEAARIATESMDLDEILQQVAREVHDRFGYFAVAVWLCDDRDVVLKALNCEEKLDLQVGFREKLGSGVAGQVAASGQVFQAGSNDQFEDESALRQDIQSILCMPLRAQRGVIGAIQVQSLEKDAFGGDDRLVMETLAKSVAGAIDNARSIRQTEQLREDLNRMIVHDLRNPVQTLLFTLQEVHQAVEEHLEPRIVEAMEGGISCTGDILSMVNSLLDVSRFEAGKAQIRKTPAVLNDHVRSIVRRFAPVARSKGIQITTVLSQDVPVLRFDHDLMNRTLANLVDNALKFTPERARVTIRTEMVHDKRQDCAMPPPYVLISVQDTGEGIPFEYHDKIFEKFGQVESRKAGLKMSTGLGLTVCRYVVEAHEGTIWVSSKPGKGSTFWFTLPADRR